MIEMVIYAGLPPPIPEWQTERDKKNKFLHWLRSNGFLVVAKDGSPGDGRHYKANVDVLLAIDAVELSVEMRPEVVVLVTGDLISSRGDPLDACIRQLARVKSDAGIFAFQFRIL